MNAVQITAPYRTVQSAGTRAPGPNGLIFTLDILLPSLPPVVKPTRCTFIKTQMRITDTYLVLKDCRLTNTVTQVLRGYACLVGTNTVGSDWADTVFSIVP